MQVHILSTLLGYPFYLLKRCMLLFRTHFIHPKKMPSTMSCSMGNLLLLNIRLYSCIIYYQIKVYLSCSSRLTARFKVAIEETILFLRQIYLFFLYLSNCRILFTVFYFSYLLIVYCCFAVYALGTEGPKT